MIGQTISHYSILEKLGEGGMGVVYRATDTRLRREVALKFLTTELTREPEAKERFVREAQAASTLDHPCIGTIYEIDETDDGQLFIAMACYEGQTLGQIIEQGPLKIEEAVELALQIAEGLNEAHQQGVIHRDMKPGNVVVTSEGRAKILDFGLAKLQGQTQITREATMLGTAAYMSPEQVRGETVDHRTDIWSLGVMIYEMMTGARPFEGDYEEAVIYSILNEEPEPMTGVRTGVPMALERVVAKGLSKDPGLRYQHADEMAVDLRTIKIAGVDRSREAPTSATVAAPARIAPVRLATWRRALPWALASFLGVAAIGSWLSSWSASQLTEPRTAHVQIALPPGVHLAVDTQHPALALSPDGTQLAFVGDDRGTRRLYLRALADPVARRIMGTEGAASPFYSPAGDWIGFFAGRSLKKVAAAGGGPVAAHASLPTGVNRGATWGTDDTVIIAPSATSGLHRGSVAGDTEHPFEEWAAITDPSAPYAWPYALPGGQDVLFTDHSQGRLTDARVGLLSTREAEIKTLINGATGPRFSPTGHILFARGRGLYAVPFDPRRAEVTGVERKLLDGLVIDEYGAAQFAVGDGATLAYVTGDTASKADELVWVDRQGGAETLLDNGRRLLDPRLSPDGTRLAVTSPTGANSDIWLLDLERSTFTRLTSHPGEDLNPVWSPDGETLALASEIDESAGGEGPALAWMPTLDALPELLIHSPAIGNWEFPCSWSPDGRWLAYINTRGFERRDIWLLPMDGAKEPSAFLETRARKAAARFSTDGRWIAYVSDISGRKEVYVRPFPGPGGRIQISTAGGIGPVWARDGRELFYREGDKLMVVALGAGQELGAAAPEMLFEGRFRQKPWDPNYDVSPDGSRFVMVREKNPVMPTVIHVVLNWPEALLDRSVDH